MNNLCRLHQISTKSHHTSSAPESAQVWVYEILFERPLIHKWNNQQFGKCSKTCVKQPLSKRLKIGFQDQLSLTAGQKYCRMLLLEHSAILLTCSMLPLVIKIFVLSFFEWSLKTGFTVLDLQAAKPTMWMCLLRDSDQSDQSLCCPHEESANP